MIMRGGVAADPREGTETLSADVRSRFDNVAADPREGTETQRVSRDQS